MKQINKLIIILILFFYTSSLLYTQEEIIYNERAKNFHKVEQTGEGREFWLCFMINYFEEIFRKRGLDLQLFITGDFDAQVTIEFPKIGYKEVIDLKGGEVTAVKIDKLAQTLTLGEIEPEQAIHITSTMPITVYGLNRRSQTTDTFLGYPVEVLGTEYMIMSYLTFDEKLLSIFAIVATEDNTTVEITPSAITTDMKPPHKPFVITMNKGDVYQCAGRFRYRDKQHSDLTGSIVRANKKIAVFGGHQCANVPSIKISACNHLVEQMPPINSWGKHFYLGKLKMKSQYTYRVLASQDSTSVFCDTSLIAVLMKGQFLQNEATEHIQITANKPVLVAQYSPGSSIDNVGDPMMLLVSPTQQFLKKYRFATPVNGNWHHLINVFVPTSAINSFRVNGKPVNKDVFEKLGVSRFSTASIRLPYGSHTVECSTPFGLYSYGFGFGEGEDGFDAYGNIGGQSFVEYIPALDTLPPMAELYKTRNSLLLSDDRTDDMGMSEITIVEQKNIICQVPNFVKSAPSVFVNFRAKNQNEEGKLILKATDVAKNETYYTICYVFDNTALEYVYVLNSGKDVDCISTSSIQLGLFYNYGYNFYSADFNKSDNFESTTNFHGLMGHSGIIGISAYSNIYKKIGASVKLILQTNKADFNSVDTVKRFVQDSITGNYLPYFESKSIALKHMNLNLDLGVDYRLSEYMYLSGGFSLGFALNKNANCEQSIFFPPGYAYDNGKNNKRVAEELNSISSFNLGIYVGPGFICNIGRGFSVFTDINYYYFPFSQLDDANLFMQQFNIKFGIKYSFIK